MVNEDERVEGCFTSELRTAKRTETCVWPIMQNTESWNKFNKVELNNRQG